MPKINDKLEKAYLYMKKTSLAQTCADLFVEVIKLITGAIVKNNIPYVHQQFFW